MDFLGIPVVVVVVVVVVVAAVVVGSRYDPFANTCVNTGPVSSGVSAVAAARGSLASST